ncbi:hypothetical protein PoB_005995400 [Plakobranchus ocellatus]|uniref:Uncharacterized protein n=1 Tax=Plakobranchus ocellatus TaxID=259542 RepID=A0AAV4CNJ4_9GAST|nr:hypothetical protein PoB_005995400 [Plakobranchus ocellatus]
MKLNAANQASKKQRPQFGLPARISVSDIIKHFADCISWILSPLLLVPTLKPIGKSQHPCDISQLTCEPTVRFESFSWFAVWIPQGFSGISLDLILETRGRFNINRFIARQSHNNGSLLEIVLRRHQ